MTVDVVAVHKPPTLPVHVTGQFRKNTVVCVLNALRPDLGPLFPVHRLDKPVSGLLLLARSPEAAARLSADIQARGFVALCCVVIGVPACAFTTTLCAPRAVMQPPIHAFSMSNPCFLHVKPAAKRSTPCFPIKPCKQASKPTQNRDVTKIYVARVLGTVPWQELTVDAPLTYNPSKRVALVDAATGKPSVTAFTRLFVEPDGLTSVVECRYDDAGLMTMQA